MKKILAVLCTLCLLVACHNTGKKQQKVETFASAQEAFEASLTAQDTTAVMAATDEIMSLLQSGELDNALSHIYVVYENVLYRPSEESLASLKSKFTKFPVCSYKMTDLVFQTSGINDVTYQYAFAESKDGSNPPTLKLGFNPVKVKGKWYVTFKDGNMTSKALQEDLQMNDKAPAPGEVTLSPDVEKEK